LEAAITGDLRTKNMPRNIEVRFVTGNPFKIDEAREILGSQNIEVIATNLTLYELQTTDTTKLINDKMLKAFQAIGRPLFVEHTGLYLEHLNGLPGGLTQIFWDSLLADRFSELFGKLSPNNRVMAKTSISYCDGKQIHNFEGEIMGQITETPRGARDFQWDCVFQPDGYSKTFAELGSEKNKISMRRLALDKLADYISKHTS
jgi:XTP/dITP diphosphohydrolase